MKKMKNKVMLLLMLLVFAVAAVPVQAKTVQAKTYGLKDIRKAVKPKGEWVKKPDGVRFRLERTGTAVRSKWINVNGRIYYMDSRGKRAENCWVKYRGNMYRVKKTGEVMAGWLRLGKKTYYLRKDGVRVKGIRTINRQKYYFDKFGVQKTGWQKYGKHQYYFDRRTGYMRKSCWIKTGTKYYYVGSDGRKRSSCWLIFGKNRYYLDETGARVTGKYYIGDKGYYFKKNGIYDPSVKVKPLINPSKPMIALTFDDGPGPYTSRLLDCLKKNKAKATFFMVGSNVPNHAGVVRRMADMGCELGGHSYSHKNYMQMSLAGIRADVQSTVNNIKNASGKQPTVFRLPYGEGHANGNVLNALGLPSIYWSLDTRDWANTGNPQHTINEVLNNVRNGDIVLMHDIHLSTVRAAEVLIPELKRRGYQLVTVSQLAKYRGHVSLRSGKTYYHFR